MHAILIQATEVLLQGDCVVVPTETVYGLAADATRDTAVLKIYDLKTRPAFNPLIAHYASLESMHPDVAINAQATLLAAAFWPGPLTLVLPKTPGSRLSSLTTAGLMSAAVRVPRHTLMLELLAGLRFPLAAPSANRSGRISPTTPLHVQGEFGVHCPLILDGGACTVGLESTIVDLTTQQPRLLRPGAVTKEMIEGVLGIVIKEGPHANDHSPNSPGQLTSHYAPLCPIRLHATHLNASERLLAFGPITFDLHPNTIFCNLSQAGDIHEAALNLFAMLRTLDNTDNIPIAVMPVPMRGVGIAINDRLRRAAAKH